MKKYDLIIIGAGPAGISAAVEAGKTGLSVLLIDKGAIVNSIQNFPTEMIFFSTAELLEIAGVPFISTATHPTRAEAVSYYTRVTRAHSIEFNGNTRALSVEPRGNREGRFVVEMMRDSASLSDFVSADNVVVATGFYDNPNLLKVPGEELPNVSHYYGEPGRHYGQRVVIVGGKNSAVEAALDLYRHGVNVILIHRQDWFGKSVKYWILPDIENRVRKGEIRAHFNSKIVAIRSDRIITEMGGEKFEVESDFVYLLTGYHPNVEFLGQLGVMVDSNTGVPHHDPSTLETNVGGIYVAGSIVAGFDCNKIFIENGREHGKLIAAGIMRERAHSGVI